MKVFSLLLLLLFPVWGFAAPEGGHACHTPSLKPKIICEESGEFLCVNTPPGSIAEESLLVKGKLNLEGSGLAHLTLHRQHELTKISERLNLSQPLTEHCWEARLTAAQNYCLESNGRFSVRVPLPELGAYTLFIAASRPDGESMKKRVRTSYVMAPTVTEDTLSYDPDLKNAQALTESSHVQVTLDLLKGCGPNKEICDFIGAGTGGLLVTIENRAQGQEKYVRCVTDAQAGESGRFMIGVPLFEGNNQFQISVCNAATGYEKGNCPILQSPLFSRSGSPIVIELLAPLNQKHALFFDPDSQSNVDLKFRISGLVMKECGDQVTVNFNQKPSKSICPDAGGLYHMPLMPKPGYNTVQISVKENGRSVSSVVHFGWGKKLEKEGDVWPLHRAVGFYFSKKFLNDAFQWVDRYLESKDFHDLLESIGGSEKKMETLPSSKKIERKQSKLSYCAGGGLNGLRMELTRKPTIGALRVDPLIFGENRLEIPIHLENFEVGIKLIKDADADGTPDIDPLPLKIAFKKAFLKPILINDEQGRLILSAPQTDCVYKRKGACLKMPALIVPKYYTGNAAKSGAFAVCDESISISKKMDRICHAFNQVDRQTGGVMQEKILDSLNRMYVCAAEKITEAPIDIAHDLFRLNGGVALDKIQFDPGGVSVFLQTIFGGQDPNVLIPSREPAELLAVDKGVRLESALALVSQLFAGLTDPEGNDFSLTINETFLNETVLLKKGITMETLCDADREGEPDPLCVIRPRLLEILGSQVVEGGYGDGKTPLDLIVRPSKNYPLRVAALEEPRKLLVEFADLELEVRTSEQEFITALISGQLTWQLTDAVLLPEDPEHFTIMARLVSEESRVWVAAKEGSNKTVIPDVSLLTSLENKIKFGLDILSKPEKELKIKVDRFVFFTSDSLFSRLGLKELTWAHNGFNLEWLPGGQSLQIKAVPLPQ